RRRIRPSFWRPRRARAEGCSGHVASVRGHWGRGKLVMANGCGLNLLPRAVHDSPAPSGRGGQRPVSRREVLKFAFSAPVLLSLATVAAAVDGPKASAANMRLIDFTER